jgi:hypothetical protein
MNASIPAASVEESVSLPSMAETEIGKESAKPRTQIESEAERIRFSVARLTSSSVEELEGLTSELQSLQKFLKSEVERVQCEIENALAGIKIIIETIAPWKSTADSVAPSRTGRAVRGAPAGNVTSGSRPYGK